LAALLGCLAILIQGLVVQAHVHHDNTSPSAHLSIVAHDAAHLDLATPVSHKHSPNTPRHSHQTGVSCLLCQSALAGSGVLPTAPSLFVANWLGIDAPYSPGTQSVHAATASHHWQSRGPPLSANA
jgi:hypothetical protein